MKKIFLNAVLILLFYCTQAQIATSNNAAKKLTQLSIRGGLDFATKHDFTSFVKMPLKGFNAGASFDKYWNWYGVGIDVDYLSNEKPEYDRTAFDTKIAPWATAPWLVTGTQTATKLDRLFIGIGPSFKLQTNNNKFIAEINLRGGVTNTKGSSLYFTSTSAPPWQNPWFLRNGDATGGITTWGTFYHNGYNNEWLGTAKAQVRLNYYFTPKIAANLSGYYIYYWGSKESYNYLDVNDASQPYWGLKPKNSTSALTSVGFSAGLSFRFGSSNSDASNNKRAKNNLTVLVKDELTNQPIKNAVVTITNAIGKIYNASTDNNGTANFSKIEDGNYKVTGALNDITTTEQSVVVNNNNRNANATLIHNDPRFTVVGKAINLINNAPEAGVNVTLKNPAKGSVKMGTSQSNTGSFNFQLDGNSDYELVGKKASYISNIEKISTKGLTRSQTLYVELELGVEEVRKGQTLILNKIYYDLDKANVREDASSDLEKLIIFLQDNPSFNVEIASHTDSRGDASYNQKLSQDRAQAVVNYLLNKDITKARLIARGYGESRLINRCADGVSCNEEQHQANRRTEFKVLEN
jgi:outer membrane protein OmpA-like peptidoglycan-associated protein